jgi:adenine-specific DNA-methyltransferase
MTFNGNTPALRMPLVKLLQEINGDHWSLMQLLLSVSTKQTFSRILSCPTYPSAIKTKDLSERLSILNGCISADPFCVANILALLYESNSDPRHRKRNGQYFTPKNIAEEAIKLLHPKNGDTILDAGCGTACFAVEIVKQSSLGYEPGCLNYLGVEKDPILTLSAAISLDCINAPQHYKILYGDFVGLTVEKLAKYRFGNITGIVSNPPFIRYHRLGERTDIANKFGISLFSGMHSYFLVQSASLLSNGRMVFIIPLEMEQTNYGAELIRRLSERFLIDKKTLCYNRKERIWYSVNSSVLSNREENFASILYLRDRSISTEFKEFDKCELETKQKLGSLSLIASVHRGISTGANKYFVFSDLFAKEIGIPSKYLTKVIPPKSPRDELADIFTMENWEKLKRGGRACWLLSINPKTPFEDLPSEIREYVKLGERKGVHLTPTCRGRKPWYSVRIPKDAPTCIFTYMFHNKPKFMFNDALVFNLTNLLGVYFTGIVQSKEELINSLNMAVSTWVNQCNAGRKYSGGLVKMEPSDLEKMPVPMKLLIEFGLTTLF